MKILICGGNGSIGRKHIENLRILGEEDIDICDKTGGKYTDIYQIQNANQYELVIIATPTDTHLEAIHFFNDRQCKYIMCEKPLCLLPTANQLLLEEKGQITMRELTAQVYVNHCYRHERGLLKLKELIDTGVIGQIKHVSMENSYLFEKLHVTYTEKQKEEYELVFDDSHIFDCADFLFGPPREMLFSMVKKRIVQCAYINNRNAIISIMTDVLSPRYKKRIEVRGTNAVAVWNMSAHEIFLSLNDESERRAIPYKHANHLFESMKYVIAVIKNKGVFEINTIENAASNMEFIQKILEKSNGI